MLIALVLMTARSNSITEPTPVPATATPAPAALEIISTSPLTYALSAPQTDGAVSVERALNNRRSQRDFRDQALTHGQLSQLLWAAYGVTSQQGMSERRTSPSAGALYPLEIFAVVGDVTDIEPGVYRYVPNGHRIVRIVEGDMREALSQSVHVVNQDTVAIAPVSICYSAVYERTTEVYTVRGDVYVHMEVGHSAQNVYLQATAMELGTVAIGTFSNRGAMHEMMNLQADEIPLYLMPVGYLAGDFVLR